MKRILIITTMFCALAINAWAQPPAPVMEPDDNPEWSEDTGAMEKLDLTQDQKKNMRTLSMQLRKEMIPLRGNLESKRIDLQEEMAAEQPNINKINTLVDDMAKLRAEIQKKRLAQRLKMRDILTPEQRKIWEEQRGKRMHRMGHEGRPDREGRPFWGHRAPRPPRGVGF